MQHIAIYRIIFGRHVSEGPSDMKCSMGGCGAEVAASKDRFATVPPVMESPQKGRENDDDCIFGSFTAV